MKIIAISTSPRPISNSRHALNQAIKYLYNMGVETELYDFNKFNIEPCHGCDYCKMNDKQECSIKDDMQEIYESLKTADGFILASPIYMGQLTAQAKMFLDRLYAYFMSDWTEKYGRKKVAVLVSQGQPDEDLYRTNIETYRFNFEEILNFEFIGYTVLTRNNIAGSIIEKPQQIEQAIDLVKLFL